MVHWGQNRIYSVSFWDGSEVKGIADDLSLVPEALLIIKHKCSRLLSCVKISQGICNWEWQLGGGGSLPLVTAKQPEPNGLINELITQGIFSGCFLLNNCLWNTAKVAQEMRGYGAGHEKETTSPRGRRNMLSNPFGWYYKVAGSLGS